MSEYVLYEKEGNVARVVLNRPDRHNAIFDSMFDEIVEGIKRGERDDDVKVIILKGNGPSFSVGFDLSDADKFYGGADSAGEEENLRLGVDVLRHRAEVMRDVLFSGKPIIAQTHGSCVGAGTFLMLVCDFCIAAEGTAFGHPEERYGSAGAIWCYPVVAAQIGLKKTNELLMTGRKFTAEEAERLGLINKVVPADRLDEEVAALAAAICSQPRDGLALSTAFRHLSLGLLGYTNFFLPHYATHPMALYVRREADEFNFRDVVRDRGLRGALQARDEAFGGPYWGW